MTSPINSVSTANGRYYIHPSRPGESVPSITNIIGMKNKPGIPFWYAKTVANYAADNRERLATMSREEAFALVRHTPFADRDDTPSVIGDIVHGWVERFIKRRLGVGDNDVTLGEVADAHVTARHMWRQFMKFVNYYGDNLEFTGSEFTVWSNQHGYAGTGDLTFRLFGKHILADTKTGKQVYPESAMQVSALSRADVMLDAEGRETPVPQYDALAILHLLPMSWTLYPVELADEAFECFLALKQVFDWNLRHAPASIALAPKHN